MSISSKISVLYLLVVLFSIKQSVCTLSSEADEPPNLCKTKDQDGFELKLRATLLFKESLILIDHNWLVYEVPHSSMENSYSQMLIDIYAKPIEEYWPAFKTYKSWPDMKPNVTSIYHVDLKVPILYMFLARGVQGVCYNIKTSEFNCNGPINNGSFDESFITDNGNTQFSITKDSGHVRLWNWKVSWADDGHQIWEQGYDVGYMYYTWSRSTSNKKNISVINRRNNPHEVISPDFEFDDLDWHLPPGFVYNGNFHFFDYKNVFTFPIGPFKFENCPKDDPMPVHATNSVTITPVKDYFKCVDLKMGTYTYPPDPNSLNTGKSSYWIWIIVAIVLLLLIVALFVWCFMFRGKGKDSKSQKHSSGTGRTRASSKKGNSIASKQRSSKQGSSKQGNSKRKPSTQLSSKQGTSYVSKQKPSHKKK